MSSTAWLDGPYEVTEKEGWSPMHKSVELRATNAGDGLCVHAVIENDEPGRAMESTLRLFALAPEMAAAILDFAGGETNEPLHRMYAVAEKLRMIGDKG